MKKVSESEIYAIITIPLLMKYLISFIACLCLTSMSLAQDNHSAAHSHASGRVIVFPDVPGYQTLLCDFHQHTVFSDGSVWPDIRVEEALRDGIDAISLTEHLEYQPHKSDLPHPDRNRAYEVAKAHAEGHDLLIVPGAEITRSMPPGHSNAIFIQDANKLIIDNPVAVFEEASKQDAFVFWNHPNWISQKKDGIAELQEMHRELIDKNLLHGIEVINDLTYSEEALQIALDHNLTIMGTSDIHGLVDWQFEVPAGGHRPITLVFATERTIPAIQDALVNRRTVAYFHDLLVGREEMLLPLLRASLSVESAAYQGESSVCTVVLNNQSDAPMTLQNRSAYSFHAHADMLRIEAHESLSIEVKTLKQLDSFSLSFEVMNAILAPKKHPMLTFEVNAK